MALSSELIERAMKIDPAMLGHYMDKGFMNTGIRPVDDNYKIVGPAYTVRFSGKYSAILFYAMRRAPEGSVVIVDRGGENRHACCGEGVTRVAQSLNLAGIVIDGPSTDTVGIKKLDFPVFSTGRSPLTTTVAQSEGDFNVPVNCGGAIVNPGDIIFGDADGVVVIPENEFVERLEMGEAATARESVLFATIAEGNIRHEPLFNEEKVEAMYKDRKKDK